VQDTGADPGRWALAVRGVGKRLTVAVEPWRDLPAALRAAIGEQAGRLAACRRTELAAVDVAG
jgi:hypothetical protein